MRKQTFCTFFLAFCLVLIGLPKPATSAPSSYVNQWISAMMHSGEGINNIITPDFRYSNYSFEYNNRFFSGSKGDLPFFAKKSKPTEIEVEETIPGPGGEQIAILRAVAESGLYRSWQIILLVRQDGIAKVSEIAMEGLFEGFPPGCPETAFKRDLLVTLHGTPAGLSGQKMIKLYNFRRDTDALEYAKPGADEEMLKKCTPKPNTYQIESEVVVLDEGGQIETTQIVAAKHKAEDQDKETGAVLLEENGVNFPGRLFNIGDGKEALFLTFTIEKGNEKVDIGKLYVWSGKSLKPTWSFGVGRGGLSASSSGQIEWSLKSSVDASGNPAILAKLETNEGNEISCPEGTTVTYTKKGAGFKAAKQDAPSACLKGSGVTGGTLISRKEDKGPGYHGEVQEIDWRFMK